MESSKEGLVGRLAAWLVARATKGISPLPLSLSLSLSLLFFQLVGRKKEGPPRKREVINKSGLLVVVLSFELGICLPARRFLCMARSVLM